MRFNTHPLFCATFSTGSQPFELMTGVSESLAGRAATFQLEGLSFREIQNTRQPVIADSYVLRGSYPELYEKPKLDAAGFYQSYVAT